MLYICATPIGNLKDITLRALEVLNYSDIILCEDTRTSRHLFNHHGIKVKELVALHEHNESAMTEKVIAWLQSGLTVTLISDAGTPGISDPGSRLCKKVLELGIKISPIPGASAFVSLYSVSGLDTPLLFKGFLSSKSQSRQKELQAFENVDYAVSIYESPHRILECLKDMIMVLGEMREIILGRELTKQFETIKRCSAKTLYEFVEMDSNQQKGEFVLIILPQLKIDVGDEELTLEQQRILKLILPELPPKKAVVLTHKICGGNKDMLYSLATKK